MHVDFSLFRLTGHLLATLQLLTNITPEEVTVVCCTRGWVYRVCIVGRRYLCVEQTCLC